MGNIVEKIILSLTQNEKAFISKYLKKNQFNNTTHYLYLYNHILKKGTINKDIISKEVKNLKFIKNISKDKDILLEKVLECLIIYHQDSNNYNKIKKFISISRILIEKDLFEKAQKIIKTAKASAYRYEEFSLLLDLLDLESSLCFNNCFITNYNKLKELQKERKAVYEKIENINQLLLIKAEIQQFQFNENLQNLNKANFIDIYGKSPIFNENQILSNRAKSIWLYILCIYHFIQYNYQKALDYHIKHYELYKNHPEFFSRNEVLQLFNNFLYCCSLNKNEDLFNKLMNEFLNLKNQTKEEISYIQKAKYYRTLELYHQLSHYEKAEILANEAQYYFELNSLSFSNIEKLDIQFNIFRAYIDSNNYEKAVKCAQKHIKSIGLELNSSMFKLFEFLTHYKIGNFDYLIYSINSWTKLIRSKRKQFPIEKILIKFFRSICNKTTINEKKGLIYITKEKLKELERFEQRNFINYFFDFAAWFERELEEMK